MTNLDLNMSKEESGTPDLPADTLSKFKLSEVLNDGADQKTITALGRCCMPCRLIDQVKQP